MNNRSGIFNLLSLVSGLAIMRQSDPQIIRIKVSFIRKSYQNN